MNLGPRRLAACAAEFLYIAGGLLESAGLPHTEDDLAEALRLPRAELGRRQSADDRATLADTLARWNAFAEARGIPHVVLLDHGDEAELCLGHEPRL
jgi:hypothetical protein